MADKELRKLAEKIVKEFRKEEDQLIKEALSILQKDIKKIEAEGNKMWKSIIDQFYDSYKPNMYERRGEKELQNAGYVAAKEDGYFYDFARYDNIAPYDSILLGEETDEEGKTKRQQVESKDVFLAIMAGNRGYKKGLEKIIGNALNHSKYIREKAYEFKVSYKFGVGHHKKITGTPEEIIIAFSEYADNYLRRRAAEVWNSLLPKYPYVESFVGKKKVR